MTSPELREIEALALEAALLLAEVEAILEEGESDPRDAPSQDGAFVMRGGASHSGDVLRQHVRRENAHRRYDLSRRC